MKTLILHIGTHKTGSTAIQHFLKNHKAELGNAGYYYPTEGSYASRTEASASHLAHSVLGSHPPYLGNSKLDATKCIAEMRRDISASLLPNIIVSSEHFSTARSEDDWEKIKGVFSPVVDEIQVVLYLRRQDSRVESLWAEGIRSFFSYLSFDEYAARKRDWNYFSYLQVLTSAFGKDNVSVRPFERCQLYAGDAVSDFLNLLNIQIPSNRELRNESLPVEQLEIMRVIGRNIASDKEKSAFNKLVMSIPDVFDRTRYSLFSDEARRQFIDQYRDSNSATARQYLNREDGILFHEPETSPYPVYPGLTVDRLATVSSVIFSVLAKSNVQLYDRLKASGRT